MTELEVVVLFALLPALVFFVFRSGFNTGASQMIQQLHLDGYLTRQASDKLGLSDDMQ